MLRFICDNSGISGQQVGRIDLKGIHTFFEVASSEADTVYNELKSVSFNGRKVRIDFAEGNKSAGGRPFKGGRPGGNPVENRHARGPERQNINGRSKAEPHSGNLKEPKPP